VLRAGLALIMLGIAGVASGVSLAVPVPVAVAGWIVAGLGMGVTNPTLSVLTLELSPPAQQGANSSALQLSDALFTATVLALGGSLLAAFLQRAPDAAYLGGFGVTATLALAGVLLASRTRRTA
jgi:MFS family permease